MANTFINPTVVAKECVRQLKNNCVMGNLIYRGFEEEFEMLHRGWKPGATIQVKAPVYFRTHATRDIGSSTVDLLEQESDFTVSTWTGVAFKINSTEATQNIDIFAKRFIKPAMQAIANRIDRDLLGLYAGVCNQVGTPYQPPESLMTYLQAHAKLTQHAVPMEDRFCIINPQAKIRLVNALTDVLNQPIVGTAIEQAQFGDIAGFTMYESQNVRTHTPGTTAGLGNTFVADTLAEGAPIIAVDDGADTWDPTPPGITVGDILTVSSVGASKVNACNPITGQDLGYERQFVVDNYVDVGNFASVFTSPGTAPFALYSSNADIVHRPYQTVTNLVVRRDPITIAGTASTAYNVNLAFHKDALAMVMLPLELPLTINWKAVASYDGYTVSVSRFFDGNTLSETIRFDVLYGTKILNPFMACRIAG